MWKEVFDGEAAVDRLPSDYYADEESSLPSRRVSAASDDSFDASCYVHVDNKLKSKMPRCLLNIEISDAGLENHFTKTDSPNGDENVTKSGKRVIRKRLSISQFKAARLQEKNSNNNSSNARSDHANNNDVSSSSDSDTMPKKMTPTKNEKPNTNVLSAKIQHLLFEMKRLRQLDRDILRKFLVINDTIEEQRWMVEEKEAAIKRSLSEDGEDPVAIDMHFDLVPEVPEEQEDDEESIQSVLSRQNSGCEVFDETLPADELVHEEAAKDDTTASAATSSASLVFTSSESALSLSGASSTLSSTASFPVSNRSTSPPNSHLSGSSRASSSFVSSSEQSRHSLEHSNPAQKCDPSPPMPAYPNDNIPIDVEGYYRMYGSSMKRGSYPYPTAPHSYTGIGSAPNTRLSSSAYDEAALDNAYPRPQGPFLARRGSDAPEYAYASRKTAANMGPVQQQRPNGAYVHFRPRSASTAATENQDARNRVQRISVRPDGTRETPNCLNGLHRAYSANDKTSAAYRLLQHPLHQKRIARMNKKQPQQCSFVPIEEQEPDIMYDNGPVYPNGRIYPSGPSSASERRDYQNLIDLSKASRGKPEQRCNQQPRQCPPPKRKPSGTGSAGSLTSSSSRTSSSSLASSSSNSSLHSPTKFMTNEAERLTYHPMMPRQEEAPPVWVQRRRHLAQTNEYIAIPYNKTFPAPRADSQHYGVRHHGAHNLPAPEVDRVTQSARGVTNKLTSLSQSYHPEIDDSSNILTVSYKPNTTGANRAVYNWIQTQDDITYL